MTARPDGAALQTSLRQSLAWALIPVCCCGGLPIPFMIGYAAYRLRNATLWIFAAAYLAVEGAVFAASWALENVPKEDARWTLTSMIWMGTYLGGAAHLFVLAKRVLPQKSPPAATVPRTRPGRATPSRASRPTQAWVGPYALLSKIGQGGQGEVYLARSPDGGQVAVKLLHARVAFTERDDFLAEASAARRVPGFATARVIDIGVDDGRPYIVSEYVQGPSLDQLIRREGPRSPDSLVRLAIATAAALNGIHQAGIVHRDFKPANVLLAPDGPRVIDFGIARAAERLTTSGGTKGTPAFKSPEQVEGRQASPASDIFSWGSTMYFAATGRLAFDGPSVWAVENQIINSDPDLRMVPPPLRYLVQQALRKTPYERPTASQLLLLLSR
ncbi:serine/threonine-protein kinase [Nonomuraea roseoviolacea]|uniref:Ser/Thr protein kinase n=1 Tax=Nonomuraea roseoviolacea subsp. carminata TaxID=160689 RepID=A0ABT1K0S0_9ACTN|nr:serine/threonine-protein kinase [Nonomuraea roseoviolacea]MCP2347597.1 putative Ser/Thr protein kinase [Nonomuraea roseoviolacea subsp. carminata]